MKINTSIVAGVAGLSCSHIQVAGMTTIYVVAVVFSVLTSRKTCLSRHLQTSSVCA